ncbi:MAG: hypothetical protein HYY17_03295 [Planctomycetes bacterium]|nr:hypothetical protein [Planctomycetota bacterium]
MRSAVLAVLLLAPQESIEERRDRIAGRLEEIRGLKFKEKLRVREGTRKEAALLSLEGLKDVYGADLNMAEAFLKALGFIPQSMKLPIAVTASAGIGVDSFYTAGELVLVDTKTPDDLLLYRMTFGLTDQHHPEAGLRKRAAPTFDARMALAALRAGDANVCKVLLWYSKKLGEKVSDDWLESLIRGAEKWEREDSRFRSAVMPRLLVRSGDFGYRRGGIFVETLRLKGGMDLVNKAYEKPPASTEHILHPEKYLAGEAPVSIDLSPLEEHLRGLGYGPTYRTTLGELGSAVLLETHLKNVDSGPASSGWGGDTIELFEGNGMWFIVWATEWDTEKDAAEFQEAANRISQLLLPSERNRTNVVVRRKTATAWLYNYPTPLQDGLLDALWRAKKDGKASYGE